MKRKDYENLMKIIDINNLYIDIEKIKFNIDDIIKFNIKINLINQDYQSMKISSFIKKYYLIIDDIDDIDFISKDDIDDIDEKSMKIINQFRDDYLMRKMIDKEIDEKIKLRDRYKNLIRDINIEYQSNYYDYKYKINIMNIMIKYRKLEKENQSIINQLYRDREEYRYLK